MRVYNKQDFTSSAKQVHRDLYSYNNFTYEKSITKSFITCKVHGDFLQSANKHLNGKGCPLCKVDKMVANKTKNYHNSISERIQDKHGDRYDLSKAVFGKAKERILVICKKHGEFTPTLDTFLSGRGCNLCGNESVSRKATGFTNSAYKSLRGRKGLNVKPVFYILLLWNDDERFIKLGVSYDLSKRYTATNMPYSYKALGYTSLPSNNVIELEKIIKKGVNQFYKNMRYKPKIKFGGHTECYTTDIIKTGIKICQENNWTNFDEFKD